MKISVRTVGCVRASGPRFLDLAARAATPRRKIAFRITSANAVEAVKVRHGPIGKRNVLTIVRSSTPDGLYLDGDSHGDILLPGLGARRTG